MNDPQHISTFIPKAYQELLAMIERGKREQTKMRKIIELIESSPARSAWKRGVKLYAVELIESLDGRELTEKNLLNGAGVFRVEIPTPRERVQAWKAYSYGCISLIYDSDIAERLCTPSELKKTKGGERYPNGNENWLDVQGRALLQACNLIMEIAGRVEA